VKTGSVPKITIIEGGFRRSHAESWVGGGRDVRERMLEFELRIMGDPNSHGQTNGVKKGFIDGRTALAHASQPLETSIGATVPARVQKQKEGRLAVGIS